MVNLLFLIGNHEISFRKALFFLTKTPREKIMGYQCSIILSYYTEKFHEIEKIKVYLKIPQDRDTEIEPLGDRAWDPTDMQFYAISMRDWDEKKCQEFFDFLRTIDWDNPESVQIYYTPAQFMQNAQLFNYIRLFPKLKLHHPNYFPYVVQPDQLRKGDVLSLEESVKETAKTTYNYAEILEVEADGNISACFIDDYEAQGKRIRYLKEHPGKSVSFQLPTITYD